VGVCVCVCVCVCERERERERLKEIWEFLIYKSKIHITKFVKNIYDSLILLC